MGNKRFSNSYSWGDRILESKAGTISAGILAIVMGLVFIIAHKDYKPIPRSEAVAYSGEFSEYDAWKNYRTIVFEDGSEYDVYPHTLTQEFEDTMESLKKGTKLDILVNPNNDYVIEIVAGSREILNFDESQAALDSYDNGYIAIDAVVCFCGVFLIVSAFVFSAQRKKETEKHKEKAKRRESGKKDEVLRDADRSVKSRILLEASVPGYDICYRRVKNVNEFVINGVVYDEIKGIIEFTHTLSAVVDGHEIEAGLSEDSFSYIMFDGECLAHKRRLV